MRGSRPALTVARWVSQDVDVLVVGLVAGEDGPELVTPHGFPDDGLAADVLSRLVASGATGKADTLTRVPAPVELPATSVVAVGCGILAPTPNQVRHASGVAARSLGEVAVIATTLSFTDLGAAGEGCYLGGYAFTGLKTSEHRGAGPLRRVEVLVPSPDNADTRATLARAQVVAEAVVTARDLVNTPPSHLYPAAFADRARALGEAVGIEVEVLEESELEQQGFGGIVGVGKGSSRPPRMVRMTYSGGTVVKKVALIGKGVTFDSGGISIKPASRMENMTSDMAGAAAVVASVVAAATLKLPINVTATVPMAENMPSSKAQRPGDVLTQYGGKTVQVINTDAEGRLLLADAIVRACEDSPDYLIVTATLTGAQRVALGNRTPGVMGVPEFRDRIATISQRVGENAWPMPLPVELRADLDSDVADLANSTNHDAGGMLAAALYLREFIPDDLDWAHLDVAGPAYNTAPAYGYTGAGGTGVPVRTIIAALEDLATEG